MERRYLRIHPDDSVVCMLEDSFKGDTVCLPDKTVLLREDVAFAHKICIKDMKKGELVIKYGEEIGYMLADAQEGSWIHSHNMGCDRGKK